MSVTSFRSVSLVLLLWMAGLGAAAQFAKLAVTLAHVRSLYPNAGAEIGLLLSVVSVIGILFGLTAGTLVVRFGYRRLLLFALALGAAVSFWQASLPAFYLMLCSRLIEGLSHLIIVVAAPTLIAQISSERVRGAAMTLWSTFFGVSFALVTWIGLPLVGQYGLGSLFLAHGIFMMATTALLAFYLDDPMSSIASKNRSMNAGFVWRQHLRAYTSPFISAPAIGWLFYTFTFVSLLAILPDYLPADNRNIIAGLMPLASIAASLLGVFVLLRFMSATSVVVTGFVLASATLSLFWVEVPSAIICVLLFAVLGLVQGGSFAAVPQLNKSAETQALANGAIAQMGNLGNTLGTPLLLLLLSGAGVVGLLVAVLGCYLGGTAVHVLLARKRAVAGS